MSDEVLEKLQDKATLLTAERKKVCRMNVKNLSCFKINIRY